MPEPGLGGFSPETQRLEKESTSRLTQTQDPSAEVPSFDQSGQLPNLG